MEGYAGLARRLWEIAGRPSVPGLIDATMLDPTKPLSASESLVERAPALGVYCVLVPPSHALQLAGRAGEAEVRLCSVAGFPHGYAPLEAKVREVEVLARAGVEEIDYVIDLSRVKSGDRGYVERELSLAVEAAGRHGSRVKAIVEAPLLTDEELDWVVEAAASAGVFMVKTSTGVLSKGGDPATVSRLAARAARHGLPVKAAGGVRTLVDLLEAVAAGASRVGTSSYAQIIEEARRILG
ncbi:deoxyribose-phosphate aldolase [Stetteria hydrogenophila]